MALIRRPSLRPVTRQAAMELIEETRTAVHHVDPRVEQVVMEARQIYRVRMHDSERFLSLILPPLPEAAFLTPANRSRTLAEVGKRLVYTPYTFEQLAENLGMPPEVHQPVWFNKTCYLDENFDYEKFGLMVLSYAEPEEQEQSPAGTFYICDGVHRCLALARKLVAGEVRYQSVEAILIIPRAVFPHHYDPNDTWWETTV